MVQATTVKVAVWSCGRTLVVGADGIVAEQLRLPIGEKDGVPSLRGLLHGAPRETTATQSVSLKKAWMPTPFSEF